MNFVTETELSQFEGLSPEQQGRLSDVLDKYFDSLEQGRPLSHSQLVARDPDLAGPLAAYCESIEFLQDAAAGFCTAEQATEIAEAGDWGQRQIGDFKIVREIGRGGMGVVYEALQVSLHRRVAIKVLPFAALLDSKQITRFRNEAQVAAQLQHLNIVPVFFVGAERGVHYYAMQFIDGQPLDQAITELRRVNRIEERPADHLDLKMLAPLADKYANDLRGYFRTVARLGIQAADALHAAHEAGIVHRDVKPSNLLLDQDGSLWVTDFGLARCRSDAKLTKTGEFVGTVRYMSPEQTKGQAHLVDHRTDIYSLGATLYELLTLRPAVRGDCAAAIVRELDRENPYRLRLWNARIPSDLENIVLKAMSRSRDDRYVTAKQFAGDLQSFLDGKPTIAKRPSLMERIGKWAGRHRQAVASAVAVLTLAVLGLVVSTWMLARQSQRAERALAEASENFRQYQTQLALTANNLAMLQHQNGDVQQAQASLQEAIRIQREIIRRQPDHEPSRRNLATSLINLGLLCAESDSERAAGCYEEALGIQRRLATEQPGNTGFQCDLAISYSNLGSMYSRQGDLERAVECYNESIALFKEIPQPTSRDGDTARDLAIAYNNLGMTQSKLGLMKGAEDSFRRALEILEIRRPERGVSENLSSIGGVYNNLGMVLERQGRLEASAASYSLAIARQKAACRRAPQVGRCREFLNKHYVNYERVVRSIEDGFNTVKGMTTPLVEIPEGEATSLLRKQLESAAWLRTSLGAHSAS